MTPPKTSVVVDASVVIAICAKEAGTYLKAVSTLQGYIAQRSDLCAPGVLISEVLFVLCKKADNGTLSAVDHKQAVEDFYRLLSFILQPAGGERSLVLRANAIGSGYSCRRCSDGIYIALAEELGQANQTVLLTLDQDLPNQAAKNAPNVSVILL